MANSVIGALRVNLGIDSAAFSDGLKSAQAGLQKFGQRMQSLGTTLSTRVTAPIAAIGTALGVAVTGMAAQVDELRKLAQVSNTNIEDFQRLAFASRTVGVEQEKLADIFKDVNDKVGEFIATGGGEMADFFENVAPKVGLTADQFARLSGPEALQAYFDALQKAGLSQQQMTFYMEAIADEATALIPLLQNGGQAFRELGQGAQVLSEQDAAGLKAYNDAVRSLMEALRGLTVAIANSGLLEFATAAVQKVTEWVGVMRQTNPEILKWGTIVAGLAAALGPALVAIGLFATGIAAISAPVALVVAGIAALTAGIIAFWPQIDAAGKAVNQFLFAIGDQLRGAIDIAGQKFLEFGVYLQGLSDQLIGFFAALPARMMEIGGQIIDGLWQGIQAKWEAVKARISGLASGVADGFRSALDIFSPSRVMHEIGVNIMQGLSNGMDSMKGSVEGVAGSVGQGIEGAFSGIGSSLADAIKGTKEWRDVALEAIASIARSVLSNMNFGGGLFGGLLKGLFGGLLGFSRGGTILPGGAGGIDSQLVMFRKSPNERVDISKPGQTLGGSTFAPVYNIDARGADQAAVARLERSLAEMNRNFGKRWDQRAHTAELRKTRG